MVAQAPVNGRDTEPSASEGVSRNLGEFIGDVLSLGEMQAQLFSIDLREAVAKAKMPAIFGVGALVLALGTVPVLLMALALGLIQRGGLSYDVAFLITSLVAIGIAGGFAWYAWQQMSTVAPIATRSAEELRQNLRWIKHALQKRRRAPKE